MGNRRTSSHLFPPQSSAKCTPRGISPLTLAVAFLQNRLVNIIQYYSGLTHTVTERDKHVLRPQGATLVVFRQMAAATCLAPAMELSGSLRNAGTTSTSGRSTDLATNTNIATLVGNLRKCSLACAEAAWVNTHILPWLLQRGVDAVSGCFLQAPALLPNGNFLPRPLGSLLFDIL